MVCVTCIVDLSFNITLQTQAASAATRVVGGRVDTGGAFQRRCAWRIATAQGGVGLEKGRWLGTVEIRSAEQFGDAVMRDYRRRQNYGDRTVVASAAGPNLETKSLGHPVYEELEVGQRRAGTLAIVFLDLTDFTGRSFWDDEDQVVDLADAVLGSFIQVVAGFGGFPLGLRGDGLFAGFGPSSSDVGVLMALSACAFALHAVEEGLNPQLDAAGIERVQARAGVDFGRVTFVRTGSRDNNEVNVIGFAANFAAKCEKLAKSWEIIAGEGAQRALPESPWLVKHAKSPKPFQRNYKVRHYHYYDYRWRPSLPHLPGAMGQIGGHPTAQISIG